MPVKNRMLGSAKAAKRDEFYTQLPDIERELKHYREQFKGKTVYCNCDDPRVSSFFTYFSYNFERLGLKRLITTCYMSQERDLFSQNDSERAISLETRFRGSLQHRLVGRSVGTCRGPRQVSPSRVFCGVGC